MYSPARTRLRRSTPSDSIMACKYDNGIVLLLRCARTRVQLDNGAFQLARTWSDQSVPKRKVPINILRIRFIVVLRISSK